MNDREAIQKLVEEQTIGIADQELCNELRRHLVEPQRQDREWNYGEAPATFPCWLVATFPAANCGIVYCEQGFGPAYPWGILSLTDVHLGSDDCWHVSLEHAFRCSPPWHDRNPEDYEVP
jgi:hypothetical protein